MYDPSQGEGLRQEEEEEEEEKMDPDRTLPTVDEDEEMDFGDQQAPPDEVVFPEAPPWAQTTSSMAGSESHAELERVLEMRALRPQHMKGA